mmetsp:Transcript_2715/g.6543  ORF Transcript_2715/g.6543 Transcript_2715/m.6543 type:complete len:251 (-) Transcript_2715:33-785(-)|eukprot:CAMPEP_0114564018 /NCGR_PEP_ID=MMETSP0114-20121206/13459_1 /TAXON_ID=31324 /ORGANISM="Goniomonas sp, Strain m" /LENGTH=250 /DNA_ID=CAMNT_0001749983 /DNA_START=125 /DNA_END=877 /DNA_ORIENTATION=-
MSFINNMSVVTPQVADVREPALPEQLSGSVGIILVDAEHGPFHGRVAVLTLVEGGPAEQDGRIHPGDLIIRVDDDLVIDWDLESIRLAVHGPVGSVCLLQFERPSTQTIYSVMLRRTSKDEVEMHEHELQEELDATRAELLKETIAHDAAETRAEFDDFELVQLRNQLEAARRESESLASFHAHEMALLRIQAGDASSELQLLQDELYVARLQATDERSLRVETQRECQHVQQQLQEARCRPVAVHGIQV